MGSHFRLSKGTQFKEELDNYVQWKENWVKADKTENVRSVLA